MTPEITTLIAPTLQPSRKRTVKVRPIRIDGDTAYVPLTKGYEAVIDAIDAPLVSGQNWFAVLDGRTVYANRAENSEGRKRNIGMHRLLMGKPEGMDVDHINGNGLDNRRRNLRVVTHAQNTRNRRFLSGNTSGIKGVSWHKNTSKWLAQICVNWKVIYLGVYKTKEEARSAYLAASEQFHGEFGRAD